MAEPKRPQDHKSKAKANDEVVLETFVFEDGDGTYTSLPLIDVLSPGFIRKHRRESEMDFYFSMLEGLFAENPEALKAIDAMPWSRVNEITKDLDAALKLAVGTALGE